MNKDTRLSDVVHVLLHMGRVDKPLTSEALAKSMRTNPAVFRRTMAGLREAGYVRSGKGHGGGWVLDRALEQISLLDVYVALGRPGLFAFGSRAVHPDCKVEKNVNAAVSDVMMQAELLFERRFGEITLDMLVPHECADAAAHCEKQ